MQLQEHRKYLVKLLRETNDPDEAWMLKDLIDIVEEGMEVELSK